MGKKGDWLNFFKILGWDQSLTNCGEATLKPTLFDAISYFGALVFVIQGKRLCQNIAF